MDDDKKKLAILGGLGGVLLLLVIFLFVVPAMRGGSGPEAPPDAAKMAGGSGSPGAGGPGAGGPGAPGATAPGASMGGSGMGGPGASGPGPSMGAPAAGGAQTAEAPPSGGEATEASKAEDPYFEWRADPFAPSGAGIGDLSDALRNRRSFPSVPVGGRVETLGALPPVPVFRSAPAAVPRNVGDVLPEEDMNKSGDKRVSGILWGDTIWAVLEVGTGSNEPASYVVKPGDTVENVRVQSIERTTDAEGKPSYRMIIRDEENKLKEVEMRKAPPKSTGGGMGEMGGMMEGMGNGMMMEGMGGEGMGEGMMMMEGMGQGGPGMQGMNPQQQMMRQQQMRQGQGGGQRPPQGRRRR